MPYVAQPLTTIPGLPAIVSANLTDDALLPVSDGLGATRSVSIEAFRLRVGEPAVNVMAAPYNADNTGVLDATTALQTAFAVGGRVTVPPGTYKVSGPLAITLPGTYVMWDAYFAYTGVGNCLTVNIVATADRVTLLGGHFAGSGSTTSVGLAIGTASTSGHHTAALMTSVTNFGTGVLTRNSYYCELSSVDSYANTAYNWRFTDAANANTMLNCRGRSVNALGVSKTPVNLRIDGDGNGSSTGIRVFGGVFEGAQRQQIEVCGAAQATFIGPHVESGATATLTGTVTLTNGSTAVTGVGTDFVTELAGGLYLRDSAHDGVYWTRLASVTNATAATLSDPYQGADGTRTFSVYAMAGAFLLDQNAGGSARASRTVILNPELGAATLPPPGVYVRNASTTNYVCADAHEPVIIRAVATGFRLSAVAASGGILDLADDSIIEADAANGRWYRKVSGRKAWDILLGGVLTRINTGGVALDINEDLTHTGAKLGLFSAPAITKPNVVGSWAGNAAGKNLAIALGQLGAITDNTTA